MTVNLDSVPWGRCKGKKAAKRSSRGTPFGTATAFNPDGRCHSKDAAWLTNFKESALQTRSASPEDRSDRMTEPDDLGREINALKALQRDAWRELASPTLTIFDRREIRNRVKQSEPELQGNRRRNFLARGRELDSSGADG